MFKDAFTFYCANNPLWILSFASVLLKIVVRSSSVSNAKRPFSVFFEARHSGGFVTLSCFFSIVSTQRTISSSHISSLISVIVESSMFEGGKRHCVRSWREQTLIYNGKLANRIERLLTIVVRIALHNTFLFFYNKYVQHNNRDKMPHTLKGICINILW